MKILHGPQNIAGMAGLLASAQRSLGHEALAICYPSRFDFKNDITLSTDDGPGAWKVKRVLTEACFHADVIHHYFGESFLGPSLLDARALKAIGKPVFHTFLGCDVRDSKVQAARHGWTICKGCWPQNCSANRDIALKAARSSRRPIFVTTPDLLIEIPEGVWLPLPVDPDLWRPGPVRSGEGLRVLHAPTDPQKKGTQFVLEAFERLSVRSAPIQLVMAPAGLSQSALRVLAEDCDLVIDQLSAGVYGAFGAEMMSLGRPVIAYIAPEFEGLYDSDLPVLNASPDTLFACLERICDGHFDLTALAAQSIRYAGRVHAQTAVAKRLEAYY